MILHVKYLDVVRLPAIVLCEAGGPRDLLHPDLVVLSLNTAEQIFTVTALCWAIVTGSERNSFTTAIARAWFFRCDCLHRV